MQCMQWRWTLCYDEHNNIVNSNFTMFISVEIHSGGRVLKPRGLNEVSAASSLQDVFDCFKNLETTCKECHTLLPREVFI